MGFNLGILWERLKGKRARLASAKSPPAPFHPVLESLEERTLLSQVGPSPGSKGQEKASVAPFLRFLDGPQKTLQITTSVGTSNYFAHSWGSAGWAILGGPGTFRSPSLVSEDRADTLLLARADFNVDGKADSVVAFQGASYLVLSAAEADRPIIQPLAVVSHADVFLIATGDYNNDRRTDLALVSRTGESASPITLQVFLTGSDGTFYSQIDLKIGSEVRAVTLGSFNGRGSLTLGDFNNDYVVDLLLTNSVRAGNTTQVLFGNRDRTFQPSWKHVTGPDSYPLDLPDLSTPETGLPTLVSSEIFHASVARTGLAVEFLVDAANLDDLDSLVADTFWTQISFGGPFVDGAAEKTSATSSATASDSRDHSSTTTTPHNPDPNLKPTPAANSTGSTSGTAKAQGSNKNAELSDSLGEELHGSFLPHAKEEGASDSHSVLPVANALLLAVAAAAVPSPSFLERAWTVLSQTNSSLAQENNPLLTSDLRTGQDFNIHGLPGFPSLAGWEVKSSSAQQISALEMGQLLLQAMIVVKLTPGSSGPADPGKPGLANNPDSLLRVAELVRDSSQFLTRLVRSIFQRYWGRDPENGEDQGWINMLLGGDKEENVLLAFLTTREFTERAQSLGATGTPDEKYLQALYTLLLDRPPLTDELETWLQGPTLDRQRAASALVYSQEFRQAQIGNLFQENFQREATPAEVAAWANSPFDLLTIRTFFLNNQGALSESPSCGSP
jgi:hypothetical protein